jgi:hypothetical protein
MQCAWCSLLVTLPKKVVDGEAERVMAAFGAWLHEAPTGLSVARLYPSIWRRCCNVLPAKDSCWSTGSDDGHRCGPR